MKYLMIYRVIKYLTYNTIRFNFRYFPIKTAIKLPVFVSSSVWLKKINGIIKIDATVKTGMIKIGFGDISIFDKKRSRSIWSVEGNVIFKGKCDIGHGSKISVGKNGNLIFGKNFSITAESSIISNNRIVFGSDCLLSWDVLLIDDDFHNILNMELEKINHTKEILIGNKTWIGCRCLILKGAIIPNNSVIAAGSVVSNKLIQENAIYGSNPLKILKKNILWEID